MADITQYTLRHGPQSAADNSTEIVDGGEVILVTDNSTGAAKSLRIGNVNTATSIRDLPNWNQFSDAEKAKLACRRVSLEYGAGLERLGCPALDALLRDAAAGRVTLVRLDFADGPPAPGSTVTITGGNAASDVRVLGPAALADPQLQTSGALAIVHGPAASRFGVGQVFDARISTGTSGKSGVIVPRSAILRADGAMWVYRADKGGVFTRVELKDAQSAPDGWLVREGLKPGDRVAASGAGTLFGLEHGAPAVEE